jgi:hypothetical protein
LQNLNPVLIADEIAQEDIPSAFWPGQFHAAA